MSRYIDAEYASEAVDLEEFTETLNMMPTADVEEVVHAKYKNHQCTNCGAEAPTDCRLDFIDEEDISYCFNCGAKMDLE